MQVELHPAVDKKCSNGTDLAKALDVDAALVLCGLKVCTSMPYFSMTTLTHLLMVSLDTGLYGFELFIVTEWSSVL